MIIFSFIVIGAYDSVIPATRWALLAIDILVPDRLYCRYFSLFIPLCSPLTTFSIFDTVCVDGALCVPVFNL